MRIRKQKHTDIAWITLETKVNNENHTKQILTFLTTLSSFCALVLIEVFFPSNVNSS